MRQSSILQAELNQQNNLTVLYVLAGFASLFLSFWISYHENVVNADAICYLLSAEEIGVSGISAGMHLCPQAKWPFFSILIFSFAKLSQLSFLASAYMIDGLFSLITVLSFIHIVRQMGGSRAVLCLAAFVILFAHEFNSVRQYIIRDHGFWACYLLSVSMLIHYFTKNNSWILATAWSLVMVIATLFRIEGLVFFVLMPFTAFFMAGSMTSRATQFFKLYLPLLVAAMLLAVWALLHPTEVQDKLGRLVEIQNYLTRSLHNITWRYQSSLVAMKQYVLPPESMRDASMLWGGSIVLAYVFNVITNLSIIGTGLCVYAWIAHLVRLTRPIRVVLFACIAINLIITSSFYAQHLFLSKRYLLAMTLILLLWAPFALASLMQASKAWKTRLFYLLIVLMIINSMGILLKDGRSKIHIREAGDWLAEQMPQEAALYTNDYQLMHYSQHYGRDIFKQWNAYKQLDMIGGDWRRFDYLALRTSRQDLPRVRHLIRELSEFPARVFENRRGEQVLIYIVTPEEKKQ